MTEICPQRRYRHGAGRALPGLSSNRSRVGRNSSAESVPRGGGRCRTVSRVARPMDVQCARLLPRLRKRLTAYRNRKDLYLFRLFRPPSHEGTPKLKGTSLGTLCRQRGFVPPAFALNESGDEDTKLVKQIHRGTHQRHRECVWDRCEERCR